VKVKKQSPATVPTKRARKDHVCKEKGLEAVIGDQVLQELTAGAAVLVEFELQVQEAGQAGIVDVVAELLRSAAVHVLLQRLLLFLFNAVKRLTR